MSRLIRILIVLAPVCFAACTSAPPTPSRDVSSLEADAAQAVRAGDPALAARLYRQLADSSRGSARANYLVAAAAASLESGNLAQASLWLDEARASATGTEFTEIDLLQARVLLARGDSLAALEILERLPGNLPLPLSAEAAGLRGRALFAVGRHADAVAALVDREIWLSTSAEILDNQRLIWNGLNSLTTTPPPSGDDIIDGWLALAPVTDLTGDEIEFRRALTEWRQRFGNHPAAAGVLAELLASQRGIDTRPRRIALLLPMSSAARTQSMAIRDGFIAAHLAADDRQPDEVVTIYDTSINGSADAYLQAQFDGADFIVGPLLRDEVDRIVPQAGFIPTLALNFSQQESVIPPPSLFQFALAPEDEARAIAERAIASRQLRAVILFASTDRGYRLMNSFRQEYEALGGQVLSATAYVPESQNFSAPIAELLNVTRSEQRHRRLQANLGLPVEFEPRRREDVDMIFLQADPGTGLGRLLAPQLLFFNAGDIPTYATSDIYDTGRVEPETDLNGIQFPDLPLLLTPDDKATELTSSLQAFWPQRGRQLIRFYSFGFDAYELMQQIYRAPSGAWQFNGVTGLLEPDLSGRIHRRLPFAQFTRGRVEAIPPVLPPELPAPESVPEIILGNR